MRSYHVLGLENLLLYTLRRVLTVHSFKSEVGGARASWHDRLRVSKHLVCGGAQWRFWCPNNTAYLLYSDVEITIKKLKYNII